MECKHPSFDYAERFNDLVCSECGETETWCELQKVRKEITKLEAKLEAFRWIPVSERLPENYVAVLVFRTYGNTSEYFIDYICNTGNWIFSDDLPWEITHWMPLPDPPQQEEK